MKSTQTAAPAAPTASLVRSVGGYALGGLLGLGLLLVVSRSLNAPPAAAPAAESPLLSVLAEFDDLARPEVRAQLCELHRALAKLDVVVTGPLDYPIMLPPAGGKPARLSDLDRLTPEELAAARPYFQVGGWLSPRVYSPELTSAVLRVRPRVGQRGFSPSARLQLETLLASSTYGALRLSAYSRVLRLEDAAARERINRAHGVQTTSVQVSVPAKAALAPEFQKKLLALRESLAHPRVRSLATGGAFVHYAAAVEAQAPDLAADKISASTWARLSKVGEDARVPSFVSPAGDLVYLAATTDAEGAENLALAEELRALAEKRDMLPRAKYATKAAAKPQASEKAKDAKPAATTAAPVVGPPAPR